MTALKDFWSERRWGREYGYRPPAWEDNPYTLGYHIAQDIMGGSWYGPVPALRSGVVVGVGRSSKIGGFVAVRADEDGLVDTYCHLNTSWQPRMGTRVAPGEELPRLARSRRIQDGHDYMGSASTGPHCHFAVTRTADGAYNPRRGNDVDPRPIIRRALTIGATGGGKGQPLPTPEPPKRRKRTMQINAAWQDKNNTIAVQCVPGGMVTMLTDPREWAGIQAATGAEYARVENAELQAIFDRYGKLEAPAFDTATGAGATVVVPTDGQADRYQLVAGRPEWIDSAQLEDLQRQGARTMRLARDQIERLQG